MATDSDSKKGKKTKQKSNKSIAVPDDDTEQTEAGNNRRETRSTTLKKKILTMTANKMVIEPSQTKIPRKEKMKRLMMNRMTSNRNWILQLEKEVNAKEKHCQLRMDKTHRMKPQMRYSKMRKLMICSIATFVKRLS